MRLATALTVLLALTSHDVYGRLNEKEEAQAAVDTTPERRLPRGGNDRGNKPGPPARGGKPGPSRGGKPGPSPGQAKKEERGPAARPASKPVPALVMKPVEWKEMKDIPEDQDFDKLLMAQKAYVKHLNLKILAEKDVATAVTEQVGAENEADDAAVEEAEAENESRKKQGHQKLVAARMKAQSAKERAQRAREKARTLQATNASTIKALLEAQDEYDQKLKTRALKAVQAAQGQREKDAQENKDKDMTVWRGMKEDAYVKTKKAKDEAKKEMLLYPEACGMIQQAQEVIVEARMIGLRHNKARRGRIPKKLGLPEEAREEALMEAEALTTEDAILVETSQEEASQVKGDCKRLSEDQEFLESRVLKVIQNMQERELVKINAEEAREKYAQQLEEKIAAEKEAIAAGKDEAEAQSDKERGAALERLVAARGKAKEKEVLRKKAAKGLADADEENIAVLKSLIEKGTEAKETRKSYKLDRDQKQAQLILAEMQLDQSRAQLKKYPEATKDVSEKQEQLIAVLHERSDGEMAVLERLEDEEAIAIKLVEELEASEKTSPPDAAHKMQKEALMEQREERKAAREAAEETRDAIALEKLAVTEEQAVWNQSRKTIIDAEKWYEQLMIFEEKEAQEDDDGDEEQTQADDGDEN